MSELKRFEGWAAEARAEAPPRVDVTARVMETLRDGEPEAGLDGLLLAASAASLAAAVVVTLVALTFWQASTDPAIGWLSLTSVVLP